jgi:CDP-glycerol glycerophosphotransferase
LYCADKEEKMAEIKRELRLPEDKKVILYAPTWRDDEFYGHAQYKFTLKLDLAKMKEALGDEYVVLLRTHYFIADFLDLTEFDGFAWNVSKYDDIARLYLISDLLISDYSSVFFDYANLRRPMLFFTYDLEKYRSVLRGFYMNVEEELPGPMLFDTDEVIEAIRNIEKVQETYQEKYGCFCEKYCAWEDGTATEKVVNEVFAEKSTKDAQR